MNMLVRRLALSAGLGLALVAVVAVPPALSLTAEIDLTFGRDGIVRLRNMGNGVEAATRSPNGDIAVVSIQGLSPNAYINHSRVHLAKFDFAGSPVKRFGGRGAISFLAGREMSSPAVAVDTDGSVLVVSDEDHENKYETSSGRISVYRVRADGRIDRSFGHRGRVGLPGDAANQGPEPGIGIDREHRILVFRGLLDTGSPLLLRLSRRGRIDTRYAKATRRLFSGLKPDVHTARLTQILPDGRTVLGASFDSDARCDYGKRASVSVDLAGMIGRLPSGEADRTFGEGGLLTSSKPEFIYSEVLDAKELQNGRRVMLIEDYSTIQECLDEVPPKNRLHQVRYQTFDSHGNEILESGRVLAPAARGFEVEAASIGASGRALILWRKPGTTTNVVTAVRGNGSAAETSGAFEIPLRPGSAGGRILDADSNQLTVFGRTLGTKRSVSGLRFRLLG